MPSDESADASRVSPSTDRPPDATGPAATPPPPPPGSRGPRRLHPLTIVRGVPLRSLVTGLLPAVVALGSLGSWGPPVLGVVVLIVLPAVRVTAWRRHTYELVDERVVERKGVLNRQERTLDLDRIQQVEVSRTVLDRAFGTAEVRLETAGDAGESELLLRVVAESEARRLQRVLRPRSEVRSTRPRDEGRLLVDVPLAHVVLAAVTGSRLLIVPAIAGGLYGLLGDLRLADRATDELGRTLGALTVGAALALGLGVVLVALVAAAVTGILRDGGFVIHDRGGDLHVRRGPVSTREAVVPRRRLQRVTVNRSWLRRRIGFATVTLYSAGGGGDRDGDERDRRLTVPLVADRDVAPLVRSLLDLRAVPVLRAHPARARRRAVVRWVWRLAPLAAATAVGASTVDPVGVGFAVPVLGLAVPLGFLEHRHLASGRSEQVVVGRSGALNLATAVVPRRKVQGVTVAASPFARRSGLANLRIHVAGLGGGAGLVDLDGRVAEAWADWLAQERGGRAPSGD